MSAAAAAAGTLPLVFARCLGFAMKAPALSHPSTPRHVRLIVATGLALAVAGALEAPAAASGAATALPLPIAFVLELVVGAAIGLLASTLYDGAYAGGRFLDDYLGVRTSMPAANVASGAGFGRLWSDAFLVVLMGAGGMEHLIVLFVGTFRALPPGYAPPPEQWRAYAFAVPALLVQAATLIAGPMVFCALLAQVGLGALGRVVPKLSTFPLSFPVAYAAAVATTAAALPALLPLASRPWFSVPFRAHG